MLRWLIGIILGKIICESSNWQHIQRLKITILGANWQLFRLERIAKCSYFILSTQTIKFYCFVMKIKKFMLPIWWYNRDLFPLGNKYFGVFVLNGLKRNQIVSKGLVQAKCKFMFFSRFNKYDSRWGVKWNDPWTQGWDDNQQRWRWGRRWRGRWRYGRWVEWTMMKFSTLKALFNSLSECQIIFKDP